MNSTRKFLHQMVSQNGVPSSKRMITIFAFLLMATGFISNLFFNLTIDEFIYDSMKWIVIGGLGFTMGEQFAKKDGTSISTRIGKGANDLPATTVTTTDTTHHHDDMEQTQNVEYVEGAEDEAPTKVKTTVNKKKKKN